MRKFKTGDKVKIPTTKSTWGPLEDSKEYKDAVKLGLDHMWITGISDYDPNDYAVSHTKSDFKIGDYFNESDLELYEQETMKKYKVLVDIPLGPAKGDIIEGGEYHACAPSYPEMFEEVKEEFKVGDYVVILKDRADATTLKKSEVVAIKSLDWEGIEVNGISSYGNPITWGLYYDSFRKATEEEILNHLIEKSGLKVGDTYTIINDTPNGEYTIGLNGEGELGTPHTFSSTREITEFRLINNELFVGSDVSNKHFLAARGITKVADTVQVGQYEAQVKGSRVAIGCQKYSLDDIEAAEKVVAMNDGHSIEIRGITVDYTLLTKLKGLLEK